VIAPAALGRAARWAGLAGVLGNVLGVAFLADVPSPYRPGDLPAWLGGLMAHPAAAYASAWTFTVGLVALALFFALAAAAAAPRAARPAAVLLGALGVAAGALLNAAGTLLPAAAVRFLPGGGGEVGVALLGAALHVDAHFNLCLGVGLLLVAWGLGPASGWPGWHRALGVAAGLASLPVALQWVDDGFAKLLAVAGPLWLAWVAAAAWRGLWADR
jgi:hypothetical protein